jgi:hypothetical protein
MNSVDEVAQQFLKKMVRAGMKSVPVLHTSFYTETPAQAPAPVAAPQPIIINPPSITVLPAPVIMQQIATPAPGQLPPALAVPALQKKVHKAIVPPKGSGIKPCPTSLSTKDNCWEND